MTAIIVQGFDHIVLRIRDKERALAFYRDVLGLAVDWDRPELGLTHIRAGTQLIDLVTLDGLLGAKGGAGPGVFRTRSRRADGARLFDRRG